MILNSTHQSFGRRSILSLMLVIMLLALFLPLIGTAESGGGEVPNPIPPPPSNGEDQSPADTTEVNQDIFGLYPISAE